MSGATPLLPLYAFMAWTGTAFTFYLWRRRLSSSVIIRCLSVTRSWVRRILNFQMFWSQWPRGLRCGSAAAGLPRLRVRIPPGAWKLVSCECCVLSGRGLCDGLITRPEESYRLWCVWLWSRSLDNEKDLAYRGCCIMEKKKSLMFYVKGHPVWRLPSVYRVCTRPAMCSAEMAQQTLSVQRNR